MVQQKSKFTVQLQEIDAFINALPSTEGSLISVLHKAQDLIGYLPSEVQNHIAHRLKLNPSAVYGVVTFYSFFSTRPKGKNQISVCMGTACFVRGSQDVLDAFRKKLGIDIGETTPDGVFSLENVRCVGACALAPVVSISGKVYGKVSVDDVDKILAEYTGGNSDNG